MPTFSELKAQADNVGEVRKILEAVAFWFPMTVPVPTSITSTDKSLLAMPDGAVPLGIVDKEGYKFAAEVEKSEVDAFGYASPVRTDIDKAPKTIEFTLLQDGRRQVAELVYGMDLSGITPGSNGEIVFDEPPVPTLVEGRIILLGRDGIGTSEQFRGRCYPRTKLANIPEEAWTAENPIKYPLKLDVLPDVELGTPCRHYLGGKGFDATANGWAPAA